MTGTELRHDTSLSKLERLYVGLFGAPINGLRIRARRILPHVGARHRRILDAGCGQGVFVFEIARRLPESTVIGVDLDEELLARNRGIACAAGLDNCRFERHDITETWDGEPFDLVVSVDVLEHIGDDGAALAMCRSALRPGGELLLHVPGAVRRWPVFGWQENFDVEGHVRCGYTLGDIRAAVGRAGFTILESYYTYGWIETMTNNISYLITGARMRNRHLYALVFPALLALSWFGRKSRPERGAGVFVRAARGQGRFTTPVG